MGSGRVPLVWANMLHNRVRTTIGILGIAFAVILIFMQLGFLGSARANATRVYDQLDFDLLLVSPDYVKFSEPGDFPRTRLYQVLGYQGVASVCPLYLTYQYWRQYEDEPISSQALNKQRMLVLAFSPRATIFRTPEIRRQQKRLEKPGTVLFDRESREEFAGWGETLAQLGQTTFYLGFSPVRIVGQFSLGGGFVAEGIVLTSDSTCARLLGPEALKSVNIGLIKLKEADLGRAPRIAEEINRSLGPDVYAWTRAGIADAEQCYWVKNTAVGIIFLCGVWVAIGVGIVFVYQVISSDIVSRMHEFATMKALGYSDRYLSWTIIYQAILLALFGFVPGWVVAFILYAVAARQAHIPIGIPGEPVLDVLGRCVVVLGITVLLCSISGYLALSKLRGADPADRFS